MSKTVSEAANQQVKLFAKVDTNQNNKVDKGDDGINKWNPDNNIFNKSGLISAIQDDKITSDSSKLGIALSYINQHLPSVATIIGKFTGIEITSGDNQETHDTNGTKALQEGQTKLTNTFKTNLASVIEEAKAEAMKAQGTNNTKLADDYQSKIKDVKLDGGWKGNRLDDMSEYKNLKTVDDVLSLCYIFFITLVIYTPNKIC